MTTRTLTALYTDQARAERAIERLRAIGVPEAGMEIHRTDEGDIAPGNAPSGGLFALTDLLAPAAGTPRNTVVIATGVPEDLASEALGILNEDAAEVENERGPDRPADLSE